MKKLTLVLAFCFMGCGEAPLTETVPAEELNKCVSALEESLALAHAAQAKVERALDLTEKCVNIVRHCKHSLDECNRAHQPTFE